MKYLHPELEKGLDNVGRIYTPFPYWKDDNESWNDIRDWVTHFDYNCKDTTGTFWAKVEQRKDMQERGILSLFENFVMRFFPPIQEMCSTGLMVDRAARERLSEEVSICISLASGASQATKRDSA